jgi:hypothetical protein
VQTLMQGRRHPVLHCSFYRMGGEARPHSFSESGRSTAKSARAMAKLRNARPGGHARDGLLAEGCMFPMLPIGMPMLRRHCICPRDRKQQHREYECKSHYSTGKSKRRTKRKNCKVLSAASLANFLISVVLRLWQ